MTHGVLALGDSITNAGGELQLGVALQSWALWTARGLGISYTPYAVDGAVVEDVVDRQIPLFRQVNADPKARFALGCLYIGTNDIRRTAWDPAQFQAHFGAALSFLAERCDRLLVPTVPARMGRPPNPARIDAVNAIIRTAAADQDALVLDLGDFHGHNVMMADHVHPTALGQVAIAERALARLAADGMRIRVHPSTLVAPTLSRRVRLRTDLTYVWRCARERLAVGLRAVRHPAGAEASSLNGSNRPIQGDRPSGHRTAARPRRARTRSGPPPR